MIAFIKSDKLPLLALSNADARRLISVWLIILGGLIIVLFGKHALLRGKILKGKKAGLIEIMNHKFPSLAMCNGPHETCYGLLIVFVSLNFK